MSRDTQRMSPPPPPEGKAPGAEPNWAEQERARQDLIQEQERALTERFGFSSTDTSAIHTRSEALLAHFAKLAQTAHERLGDFAAIRIRYNVLAAKLEAFGFHLPKRAPGSIGKGAADEEAELKAYQETHPGEAARGEITPEDFISREVWRVTRDGEKARSRFALDLATIDAKLGEMDLNAKRSEVKPKYTAVTQDPVGMLRERFGFDDWEIKYLQEERSEIFERLAKIATHAVERAGPLFAGIVVRRKAFEARLEAFDLHPTPLNADTLINGAAEEARLNPGAIEQEPGVFRKLWSSAFDNDKAWIASLTERR